MVKIDKTNITQARSVFERQDSLALKGIAIIMLIFHHTFAFRSYYEGYVISFFPFTETQVLNIGLTCKICVSVFAFITGYGLFENYSKSNTTATYWCAKRYINTYSGYWIVWLLTLIICQIINRHASRVYLNNGGYYGFISIVLDFFGISYLFNAPKIIGPAWYMSAVAIFILAMPIIYRYRDNLGYLIALHIVFLRVIMAYNGSNVNTGYSSIYSFLTPFLFGSLFARYRWIDKLVMIGSCNRWTKAYKFIAEIWLVVFGYKVYQNTPWNQYWDYHFGLFPILVILFCIEFIVTIPGLSVLLRYLGRHSMNIFLVHVTLRRYLPDIVFARGNFMLCVLTLLVLSFLVSITIELIKKMIMYKRLVDWLEAIIACLYSTGSSSVKL